MKRRLSLERLTWSAYLVLLIAFVCCPLPPHSAAQNPLTTPEIRGKQIYVQGTSATGKEILAYLGDASLEVPGSAMACANCHGLDGQGKPEGGVSPSNLTWENLSKPYGLTHPDGRKHPAYSDRTLETAITRGLDPAGNKLMNVMPRYQMSAADLADLVVYLKRLGKDTDPGISEDRIVIGTIIPATGALAEMGQAVKAVITGVFAQVNTQGGVYNRRLELKFSETADSPPGTRANLERLLKDEQVFAMTGALIAGAEKEIVPLLAQQEVPLVGPLTLNPQTGFPLNRQVFYLISGVSGQARAMVNFLAKNQELKNFKLTLLSPGGELNAAVVEAIRDQSKKDGLSAPQVIEYNRGSFDPVGLSNKVKETNGGVLFLLGNDVEVLGLLREAEKLSWFPTVFMPGAIVGHSIFDAPVGFDRKVFFSFPTSPVDQTAEGMKEFRAFAEQNKLTSKHVAAQVSAYAGAKLLVEAMKRAGKDLSREKLIQTLEKFYEYPTGLTPAITYGPNRRVGAQGAYVITLDLKAKQFIPASPWVESN